MADFFLITGCSGGGKSTLLDALRADGYATVSEPGRRIVAEELRGEGAALPWVDMAAFARRALAMAQTDLIEAGTARGPVFFDRGVVDAAVALERFAGIPLEETMADRRPYRSPVFLAPPWQDVFGGDDARRHDFEEAVAEYEALTEALERLRYDVVVLPKQTVKARVSFVLNSIAERS